MNKGCIFTKLPSVATLTRFCATCVKNFMLVQKKIIVYHPSKAATTLFATSTVVKRRVANRIDRPLLSVASKMIFMGERRCFQVIPCGRPKLLRKHCSYNRRFVETERKIDKMNISPWCTPRLLLLRRRLWGSDLDLLSWKSALRNSTLRNAHWVVSKSPKETSWYGVWTNFEKDIFWDTILLVNNDEIFTQYSPFYREWINSSSDESV